jgi:pantoate--beta-alanine ligase
MFYLLKSFIQMKILLNNNDLNEALENVSNLGFVPTMGSLHKGHISLIKQSKKKCNKTIVSIFVNPKQFNNKNDFKKYPRNRKKDLSILKRLKVNYVYLPSVKEIYKVKRSSKITISKKDKILCAKYRKGHFEGVIDVMERLIEYIKPQKIFMGEKDFQQLYFLKKYLRKHSSKIIECRTIREKNKLALSSRNSLLQKREKNLAAKLITNIMKLKRKLNKESNIKKVLNKTGNEINKLQNVKIEYLELRNIKNLKISNKLKNSKIFVSFYINNIRLIDNF